MHRSSESIAAIATALAKAQIELSNPEKAMVGTVYNNRSDNPQSFRYASLSSGLDIVRKTLGGQQIAVAQTTDIDRVGGMVNLTTVLLHTSGEWISSDWPVCRTSEISAPRRMGAALTYARRYALFTMVGIAGEDDLDAPPDVTDDATVDSGGAASPGPAPVRPSQSQTGNGTNPQIPAKLGAEESAAIRAQLIHEIEALPEDDLQRRAIAILKAKSRLSADDAKRVEEAFAARMVLQGALPKDMATDGVALADALGLWGMEAIQLPAALAPLLGPDLGGARQRQRKRRLDVLMAFDLAADVTDQPAQRKMRSSRRVAVELPGMGVASRDHRRPLGDAKVGLSQPDPVLVGQAVEPPDGGMQQLGVSREADVLGLHRGVYCDPQGQQI
jgi:hypothetical protein